MSKGQPSERATVAPDRTVVNELLQQDEFQSVDLSQLSKQFMQQQLAMKRQATYGEDEEEEAEDDFDVSLEVPHVPRPPETV